MTDIDDPNVVKGFVNETGISIFSVVVHKKDSIISTDEKEIILSKDNMEGNVTKIYSKYEYLDYKGWITVGRFNASYIDYYSDLRMNVDSYMRQYCIVINRYIVTITFIITQRNKTTIEKVKEMFIEYRPFFEKAESMGWCPAGDKSTIARRRCPKPIRCSPSHQYPPSSGPRRMSVSAMLRNNAASPPMVATPPRNPTKPHIKAPLYLKLGGR